MKLDDNVEENLGSGLQLDSSVRSNVKTGNSQPEVDKSRRTLLVLASLLLIGLVAALVIGGISGGGVKLPCH